MPKVGKWVLTLGIAAGAPAVAVAGPFDSLKSILNPGVASKSADGRRSASRPGNQQVAEQIAEALRSARLNGYEMEVTFQNGVAILSGKVASARQKGQAEQIVSKVRGVKRVENRLTLIDAKSSAAGGGREAAPSHIQQTGLTVDPQEAEITRNQQVAQKIAKTLTSSGLNGYDIEVRYQNGTALLGGTVADAGQRTRAAQIVQSLPEVGRVNNRLRVPGDAGPAPHPSVQTAGGGRPVAPIAYQPPDAGFMQPPPGVPPAAPYEDRVPGMMSRGAVPPGGMPGAPPGYSQPVPGAPPAVYNLPNVPESAWPGYAAYPNYAAVTYPQQYSASAWPYIGPFYPYPQVPLGWRQAQLEWDDGYWHLQFRPRTDRWWWFMHPKNWGDVMD